MRPTGVFAEWLGKLQLHLPALFLIPFKDSHGSRALLHSCRSEQYQSRSERKGVMSKSRDKEQAEISRRKFLRTSGVAAATVAGASMAGCASTMGQKKPVDQAQAEAPKTTEAQDKPQDKPKIQRFRTLGRTGFKASDIGMGGAIYESSVVRYVYDRGVNLFDTAEGYGNGMSETKIGEAMQFMDRSKIFIVTKLVVKKEDTKQTLLDRYAKCLGRLKTNYTDALYIHAVNNVEWVKNPAFHAATKRLKADGKLKYVGISSHGPGKPEEEPMDKVLLAAVEDGRFDLMLLVYNFMKAEEGERVLKACKEKNIGTTDMKVKAGRLEIEAFDPENPTEEYAKALKRMAGRGMSREESIKRINEYLEYAKKELAKNKPLIDPFMAKYGIKTQDELDSKCIQWVLGNPDMHSVLVAMPEFDKVDKTIPLSGTTLTAQGKQFLHEYQAAFGHQYCRHACTACISLCPHGLPVSTMMRYSYYFQQHREKYAMKKYAELGGRDGSMCLSCSAPCKQACPHRVSIQASLLKAHEMLTLA